MPGTTSDAGDSEINKTKVPGLGWERQGGTSHQNRTAVALLLTGLLAAPQKTSEKSINLPSEQTWGEEDFPCCRKPHR